MTLLSAVAVFLAGVIATLAAELSIGLAIVAWGLRKMVAYQEAETAAKLHVERREQREALVRVLQRAEREGALDLRRRAN